MCVFEIWCQMRHKLINTDKSLKEIVKQTSKSFAAKKLFLIHNLMPFLFLFLFINIEQTSRIFYVWLSLIFILYFIYISAILCYAFKTIFPTSFILQNSQTVVVCVMCFSIFFLWNYFTVTNTFLFLFFEHTFCRRSRTNMKHNVRIIKVPHEWKHKRTTTIVYKVLNRKIFSRKQTQVG